MGICIISEKKDNLVRYTQIFENFFFRNFRLNGSLIGNSTISELSGTFPRKFPYHLSPFQKFRNFGSNGKRPKRDLLHSFSIYGQTQVYWLGAVIQCMNPVQLEISEVRNSIK